MLGVFSQTTTAHSLGLLGVLITSSLYRIGSALRPASLIGIDPWYHSWLSLEIAKKGFVPQGYLYSDFPVMHISSAITEIVGGQDYRLAILVIAILLYLSSALYLWRVLLRAMSSSYAFGAVAVYSFSDLLVGLSVWVHPTSLAVPIMVFILAILLSRNGSLNGPFRLLFFSFSVIMILLHPLSTLVLLLILIPFVLIRVSRTRNRGQTSLAMPSPVLLYALLVVLTSAYWAYTLVVLKQMVGILEVGFLVSHWKMNPLAISFKNSIPVWEIVGQYSCLALVLFMTVFGFLTLVQARRENRVFLPFGMSMMMTITVALVGLTVGFVGLLPMRWLYYFNMIAVFVAPFPVMFLVAHHELRLGKIIITFFFLIFSLAGLSSPESNLDAPLYGDSSPRFALLESEIVGLQWSATYLREPIGIDEYPQYELRWNYNISSINLGDCFVLGNVESLQVDFILRGAVIHHAFFHGGTVWSTPTLLETVDSLYCRVQDSGELFSYVYPSREMG